VAIARRQTARQLILLSAGVPDWCKHRMNKTQLFRQSSFEPGVLILL
jgi:hypothetical protein